MIRLFLRLLNIRDFDTCKSCETLKQQLEFERSEKKQLTDTLLSIIKPKTVEASQPVELQPIATAAGIFSRRRAILEQRDREEARILADSKHLGKPDQLSYQNKMKDISIEKLESELGISEQEEKTNV